MNLAKPGTITNANPAITSMLLMLPSMLKRMIAVRRLKDPA
jgi:hypothetical protein